MDSRWSPMKFLRSAFHTRHETKLSSWLPPVESWEGNGLPYGWESAIDKEGKIYYINHTNRTTTQDSPIRRRDLSDDTEEESPREVQLVRDPQAGFGFVAGSEKPVIVRFVTEGGPNEKKLMPGDQILKINGEDVMRSPREHVIELIRSCKQTVNLLVCQPQTNNTTRKSALLTAAKKAKLKNNPSKVRFSEGVTINGSPLFSPVDGNAPFLPNVLKVFLENGQTKSFKYDTNTTVQDVLNSLFEKLSIKCVRHFCLATEHVKITRKNRLTILDPKELLAKIASKPGAHHLRCVLRVAFVPRDIQDLLKKDPITFEYLYMQCCNDVVEERFMPELKYDIALRLTAVHMQQHCLSTGVAAAGKVTLKAVERSSGLERFVPSSLLETMRGKELRKLLSHFLKASQKISSPLHAKLYFLRSVSEVPSYGAKCFPTNITDSNPEMTVLVSPRYGISQISCSRGTMPVSLLRLEEVTSVEMQREDEWSCLLHINTTDAPRQTLTLSLEEKDAEEFVLMLEGYHRLHGGGELRVVRPPPPISDPRSPQDTVPSFHSRHMVHESPWSYPPPSVPPGLRTLDLSTLPPPYMPLEVQRNSPKHNNRNSSPFDHNMNETTSPSPVRLRPKDERRRGSGGSTPRRASVDERHPGVDYRTSISMELLDDGGGGDVDVDVHEARNDELILRLTEVERIVADAHSYLTSSSTTPVNTAPLNHVSSVNSHFDNPSNSPALFDHASLNSSLSDHASSDSASYNHASLNFDHSSLVSPSPFDNATSNSSTYNNVSVNSAHMNHALVNSAPVSSVEAKEDEEEEDDDDEVPEDSPLRRRRTSSAALHHPMMRRDSSFGLHSPDVLPEVAEGGQNILDILRDMREEEEAVSVCLDPDLIDLTAIPPPATPEVEDVGVEEVGVAIDPPPGAFDLREEGDRLEEAPESNGEQVYHGGESLDTSLESLLAALSPPEAEDEEPEDEVDLSAYIIPPPPTSSPGSAEAQEAVIARFVAAAEDIRTLFVSEAELLLDSASSSSSSGYDTLASCHSDDSFSVVVPARLKTSCVEADEEEVLSPSSTASSSDSSVILQRREAEEAEVRRTTTGSCDDLLEGSKRHLLEVPPAGGIVRSVSWGSLADREEAEDNSGSTFHTSASLRQNRLRRSFHRPNRTPKSTEVHDPEPLPPEVPAPNATTLKHLLHEAPPPNGRLPNGLSSIQFSTATTYEQAIRDIASVVVHLRKVPRSSPSVEKGVEPAKLCAARDVLANESRRFVAASKLFVRAAMDSGGRDQEGAALQEAAGACVLLLRRMSAVGEAVALRVADSAYSRLLLEGLEAVALAHLRTVEAAREGEKEKLMKCATQLATALTALMRTLRTI